MKKEEDRDVHVVIAAPSHRKHTMIVELPSVNCKGGAGSLKRHAMARARRAVTRACGKPPASDSETFTVSLVSLGWPSSISSTARRASPPTPSSSTLC